MSGYVQETGAQLRRWWLHLKREPFNLAFSLLQPLMFFIFFGGAFEGVVKAADLQSDSYRAFLLAGVLGLTFFGNSMAGGIALLFDKENGFLTRTLVAPVARSSILVSRFLFVNFVSVIQTLIMLALAAAFGVRVGTGLGGVVLLLAMGLLLGFGITVISLALAFVLRGHGDFFALLGVVTLPLTFLSTALVPAERMSGWMRLLAHLNPMSYAIDGMRALVIGTSIDWAALGKGALLLLVFDALMMAVGVRTLRRQMA